MADDKPVEIGGDSAPSTPPPSAAQPNPTNTAQAMFGDTSVDGKPIPFKPNIQIGRSGLKQYAGFVLEEFLPTLRGAQGAKAYREILDNSALVQGIFKQIQLSMRQVKKEVQPFSEDAEDVKRAERVEQALDDMSDSWEDVVSEACTMIPYGYAPMEITYKKCGGWGDDPQTRSRYDDGMISWRKVALRAQDTLFKWEFDEDGGVRAMVQLPPPDFVLRTIPIEKLLLFRPSVEKGNPEGYSALRSSYFNWIMVKRLIEFEAIKGERSATGVPVIYTPAENLLNNNNVAGAQALRFAKNVVRNIRVDDQMGIVMPMAYDPISKLPLWKLELLSEGRATDYDYDKVITRHETRIAMSLLAGAAMLGHDQVGSYALASTKWESELAMGLNAWLDSMFAVWNRHALPRLYALNGWPMDRMCTITHEEIAGSDVESLADAALKLSQAGMDLFPDEALENHVRAEMGWPELVEGEWEERQAEREQQAQQAAQAAAPQVAPGGQKTPPVGGKPQGTPPKGAGGPPGGGGRPLGSPGGPGTGAQAGKGPKPLEKGYNARSGKGRFASRAASSPPSHSVTAAVGALRDRLAVNGRGDIDHGFVASPELPGTKEWRQHVDAAPLQRVPLKGLIATQPTVRRDHVRTFIENPDIVVPGQRALTGQHEDRPVVMARGGKHYILDGHHRLAAKAMMGYTDAVMRVIDGDEVTKYNHEHVESGPDGGQFASGGGAEHADPAGMKPAEINRELDKLEAESGKLNDQMIAEGRGSERPSETRGKTDPLSRRINAISDRKADLHGEIARRYGPGAPSRMPTRRKSAEEDEPGLPANQGERRNLGGVGGVQKAAEEILKSLSEGDYEGVAAIEAQLVDVDEAFRADLEVAMLDGLRRLEVEDPHGFAVAMAMAD